MSSKARSTTTTSLGAAAAEAKAAGFTVTDVKNGIYEQIKANPDLKLPDQFQQVCGGLFVGVWEWGVVWVG